MARTICMQFEGNWTPVTDIVVDKVGKYAYVIGSPHDAAATPVVMDVVLDVRTKVCAVNLVLQSVDEANPYNAWRHHQCCKVCNRPAVSPWLQSMEETFLRLGRLPVAWTRCHDRHFPAHTSSSTFRPAQPAVEPRHL